MTLWLQPPIKLRDSRDFQAKGRGEGEAAATVNVALGDPHLKMMATPSGITAPCQPRGNTPPREEQD